jgi:hypothetical protein
VREARRQTFDDGGSREQAAGYFLYVLEILLVAAAFAHGRGHPADELDERLRAMLAWLAATADVAGEPPLVGDDAEDRMLRIPYFGERRAADIAGRASGPRRAAESVLLRQSGYAVLRSGDARVVFDVGGLGFGSLAAHGHADALAVLVDTATGPLLRDSGTGAYAPPTVREPYRATRAHNTVVVGPRSQAQPLGPHLWGRRFNTTLEAAHLGDSFDVVRASHDGYPGAIHSRSVVFVKPDLLVVLDRVEADGPRDATLVWQPLGDAPLTVASVPGAIAATNEGPYSPRYATHARAPRRTWTARSARVNFATTIALARGAATARLRQEGGTTVVEVEAPRRVRIVERWQGPAAVVEL